MFTGIVKDIGKVISFEKNEEGIEYNIETSLLSSAMKEDDSVSIDGVCQTVTCVQGKIFTVQAVSVTLQKTTLQYLKSHDLVNLELALQMSDRFGGHFVTGHVNGMATITSIVNFGKNYIFIFKIPSLFYMKYIVKEGSITLDGVSLTIADIDINECTIEISLIPHTWEKTLFYTRKKGDKINFEIDLLAKYIENFKKF